MNQKPPYFLLLFLCFSLNTVLNAQTENDSLAKYSYEELRAFRTKYRKSNNELSKIYIDEYLKRSIKDKDTVKTYYGYFFLSEYYEFRKERKKELTYIDNVIKLSKKKEDKFFPSLAYLNKGIVMYHLGENEEALKFMFKALRSVKKNKNINLEVSIRSAIVVIKANWSETEETLNFTRATFEFLIKNKNKILDYENKYFDALFNLVISHIKNNYNEKAIDIAEIGISESLNYKNDKRYYSFVSLGGVAQYYLENYHAAIDSSLKALPYMKNHGLAMRHYYLAKSYDKLNQPEKAQFHFLKTDSIYQATKDIFPEMRNVYEHIIDYYKSKNDTENQIKYYDLLLETDKVIDSTYTYVKETIEKKFDTPQAIAERARLVEELETKKNSWKYRFGAISIILLVILGILVAAFRRQKYYKQRFENLMVQGNDSSKDISTALNVTSEKQKNQTKNIDVPKEIVDNILNQLKKFEDTKKFTKQVSITSLAKSLKTNPKYLSKVINWHYKKNFSHYISELRIEYVISRLKEDSKFRNYTIKAIAKEAGFGNTESFSKAFHKSTGIKPSYFIKELHKRLEG